MDFEAVLHLWLLGCSSDNYAQWLVCDGLSEHFRPVVMNNRGNGGVALRVSALATTHTLALVVVDFFLYFALPYTCSAYFS